MARRMPKGLKFYSISAAKSTTSQFHKKKGAMVLQKHIWQYTDKGNKEAAAGKPWMHS